MSGPQELLPKSGLVVSQKGELSELLCKPKIMPLKSITLLKLEEMEVGVGCSLAATIAGLKELLRRLMPRQPD